MEKTISQKVREDVNNFKTKHKEGFTQKEIDSILKKYPGIHMDKFNEAMMGNTCMLIENETIIYHCDVEKAIICGVESRKLKLGEWD